MVGLVLQTYLSYREEELGGISRIIPIRSPLESLYHICSFIFFLPLP